MDEPNKDQNNELTSLEEPASVGTEPVAPSGPSPTVSGSGGPKLKGSFLRLFKQFNIYLLLFVLVLIVGGAIATVLYLKAQSESANANNLSSQSLSQSALDQLATSDVTVGEPKHTLNVESNAVFSGAVLVRGSLQIAGNLQVGSNLAINGLRVTGSSTFDDVQVTKSLALSGDGSIQGQLNIQKGLNVNGTGTFQGALSAPSLTVGTLQISGDLALTHHIAAGGGNPSRSNGAALGSGGTASVSGSDTAGSVTINTGGSPGVGCFITVNFTTRFNATPHIVITPVGSGAAGLAYYITRSTSNFSICTTTPAPASTSFGFDYVAFD